MQAHRPRNKTEKLTRGVVTVEMALTLPLYFLLLFAAIEFARVNVVIHTMENAAYEGARRMVVPGATTAQGEAAALAGLTAVDVRNATVTPTPAFLTGVETEVTITIDVPLNGNAWISPTFFKDVVLSRSCTLSTERTVRVVE